MQELILYKACPLCEDTASRMYRHGDCSRHPLYKKSLSATLIWLQCQGCGHIFRNGYYSKEACAILFSDTHVQQRVGHDYERQRPIAAHMVEKILPYAKEGAWLDIGFGNAALLLTAQEYGFTPVGLDVRADNVRRLQQLGIEAHALDFLAMEEEARFSVISMADVLEHMPYPIAILQKAHKMLRKDGLLFLSMPNCEAPLWQLWDRQNSNPYWGEIEHYHNFGRSGLYQILSQNDFVPLSYGVSERYRAGMEVVARKKG